MKMIIGGQNVDSSDKRTINVFNPSTHEVIDSVPCATQEDVEKMLIIAQEGKRLWGNMTPDGRCDILEKAASLIYEKREKLATLICCEQGKIYSHAMDEAVKVSSLFKGYAEKARYMYGTLLPDNDNDIILVRKEPLGVIACIIPFNFPGELFAQKVAPALAAGNAVVVKPASDTPLSDIYLISLLHEAGVPVEAAQIVTGSGAIIGKILSSSRLINGISVTGSTEVGIDIAICAARNLVPVFLELGGNDALVIFDDVDLDYAVNEAVSSRVYNAGQVCCSVKRCVVHNSIKKQFAEKAVRRMKQLKIGNAISHESDMGPLINETAAIKAEKQIANMVALGARCLLGGRHFDQTFFEPTVLYGVTPDMPIAKDLEVFAPIITIIGFDTEDEALQIVNQSMYGLSGGVISGDMSRGVRIATKIDSGGIVVGAAGMYRTNHMPFGGHKMSGMGTEGFLNTLEEMVKTKSIILHNVL